MYHTSFEWDFIASIFDKKGGDSCYISSFYIIQVRFVCTSFEGDLSGTLKFVACPLNFNIAVYTGLGASIDVEEGWGGGLLI